MIPYYQDEFCTIYHGDSRELIPSLGKFDLLLTDPPYGSENGVGYGRAQNHGGGRKIANDGDLIVFQKVMAVCAEHKLPNSWGLAFAHPKKLLDAMLAASNVGWLYFSEIVWDKATPGLGYTLRYQHEPCMVFTLGDAPPKPERVPLSLVRFPVSHVNTQARHPHEKPVDFWHNAFLFPGARAVDPFMGTGNTLRAGKNLGRHVVGIEIEEQWCEQAARKLQQEAFNFGGI